MAADDETNYTSAASSQVQLADLFDLTRAMPDETDMAGIIMVLNRVASGHRLDNWFSSGLTRSVSGLAVK